MVRLFASNWAFSVMLGILTVCVLEKTGVFFEVSEEEWSDERRMED